MCDIYTFRISKDQMNVRVLCLKADMHIANNIRLKDYGNTNPAVHVQ